LRAVVPLPQAREIRCDRLAILLVFRLGGLALAAIPAAVGCVRPAPAPPVTLTSAPPDPFFIPQEVRTVMAGFAAQLARDVPRGQCDALASVFAAGGAFDQWCRQVVTARVASVEVEHELIYMQGAPDSAAVVFALGLYAKLPSGAVSSFLPGEAAIAHLHQRHVARVELDQKLETLVGGVMLRQTALLALDPAQQRLEADTQSRLRLGNAPFLAIRLRGEDSDGAPGRPGFVVHEVSQNGEPCQHRRVGNWLLLVAPARAGREVDLRIRYGGKTPWRGPLDHVRSDEVILRKEALWLPLGSGPTAAEMEVTVVRPAELELFGQGSVVASRVLADGRASTTWRHRGDGFALYGGPDYVVRRVQRSGAVIELGARAADPGHLEALDRVVTQALVALSPLGPYPYAELRVTESDFGGGQAGYGAISNITLGRKQAHNLAFLTHELAHGWFPGAVPAAAGYWPEGLAEYLSSWALGGDEARALRAGWSAACGAIEPRPGHSSLLPPGEPWPLQKLYVYDCPAAALAALEERHGRAAMAGALVGFLRARAGRPSTWDDLIQAFGSALGGPAALQLRHDLGERAPVPTVRVPVPQARSVPAKGPLDAAAPGP
jgi:hypothetical protein